jgi:hypothetical protein
MHPFAYTLLHRIKYMMLPAPYGYTEAHARGYFIDTTYGKSKITPFTDPAPFPLQKAVLNQMYEIECVMLAPSTLLMRTPTEWMPWFANVEFQQIFGQIFGQIFDHRYGKHGATYNAGGLLLATNVMPGGPDFRVSETTKVQWEEQRKWMPTILPLPVYEF